MHGVDTALPPTQKLPATHAVPAAFAEPAPHALPTGDAHAVQLAAYFEPPVATNVPAPQGVHEAAPTVAE